MKSLKEKTMGIRSEVAIAIKTKTYEALSKESKELLNDMGEVARNEEGRYFKCDEIKWYIDDDSDLIRLYSELSYMQDGDYLIVEACPEFPESTQGDAGAWFESPWDPRRYVEVSISDSL